VAEPAMDEAGTTAYAPIIRVLDRTSPRLALGQMDLLASPSLSWLGLTAEVWPPMLLVMMTAT
jgi:hypothetical protein